MRIFYGKMFLLATIFVMLASACAQADIIYLKNGGKITGIVTKDDGTLVSIDIGSGTVVHNKKDIARIKKEALPKASVIVPVPAANNVSVPIFTSEEKPKQKMGVGQILKGIVDTAFSIIKFDFLKKSQ